MSTVKTMQAAFYDRYGAPDVLRIKALPVPRCGSKEVLVRNRYSTVTRTDCGFLRAKPAIVRLFAGLTKPRSQVLGCEFAGEIVETGSEVTDFSVGDRVVGFKDDDHGFGGHAQYTAMPVDGLLGKIPEHMSYEQAAPALEGSHYALHYLRAAGITQSHQVLVNGGTGAIGSAAIQIIRSIGAEVTAVCGTGHTDTVAALGADTVIDYQKEDFTELSQKFDVVFDAVGKSTFGQCKRILKPDGSYLSTELGPYGQNPVLALLTPFLGKQRVHFPIPKNTREDAQYLCSLMEKRQFLPLIDRTYPLSDIVSAFHYVETGEKIGNVLIDVDG